MRAFHSHYGIFLLLFLASIFYLTDCYCDKNGTVPKLYDQNSGKCMCKEFYEGRLCDRCKLGYYDSSNCRPCKCSPSGAIDNSCDASGKCSCRTNFAGQTCEMCNAGYYKYPECLPCTCDNGTVPEICEKDTGKCLCDKGYKGKLCARCKEGYYGPNCTPCNCSRFGSKFVDCNGEGQCSCSTNFAGRTCDMCSESYEKYPECSPSPTRSKDIGSYLTIGMTIFLVIAFTGVAVIIRLSCLIKEEKKRRKQLEDAGWSDFEEGRPDILDAEVGILDQADALPYDTSYEFDPEKLKIVKQLGHGAFGYVSKAEADGILQEGVKTTVAVKLVKNCIGISDVRALATELKIMIRLGTHPNIVNLLGACTRKLHKREIMVIVEYCEHGSLDKFLRRNRPYFTNLVDADGEKLMISAGHGHQQNLYVNLGDSKISTTNVESDTPSTSTLTDENLNPSLTGHLTEETAGRNDVKSDVNDKTPVHFNTLDLICWCFQVACAMDYLESRKVIHADLAARNILLDANHVVKICDFGLSKNLYESDKYIKRNNGKFPLKWTAPEAIVDREFSSKSDVWSFGVACWEIFTLAQAPYGEFLGVDELLSEITRGYRLERPPNATKNIYSIMRECWNKIPSSRPSFSQLADKFRNLSNKNMQSVCVERNKTCSNLDPQKINELKKQDTKKEYIQVGRSYYKIISIAKKRADETNYLPSVVSQQPDIEVL